MLHRIFAISLFFPLLGGCIGMAVPVQMPEKTPFREELGNSIVVGETTRDGLLELYGKPAYEDEHRRVFSKSRDGWAWGSCGVGWAGGGCEVTDRTKKDFYLATEFGVDGVLQSAEVYTAKDLCDKERVCFKEGRRIYEIEPATEASQVVDGCSVFFYIDEKDKGAFGDIYINGARTGSLVGPGAYQFFVVGKGPQLVEFRGEPWTYAARNLQCNETENVYLRYDLRHFIASTLNREEMEAGRHAVAERWRAAPAKGNTGMLQSAWLEETNTRVQQLDTQFAVLQADDSGDITHRGYSYSGEPCGIRSALAHKDFRATTINRTVGFTTKEGLVEVRSLCNATGNCQYESIFEGGVCNATPVDTLEFFKPGSLLVLEPSVEGVSTLFYGPKELLKDHMTCPAKVCYLEVDTLRSYVAAAAEKGE